MKANKTVKIYLEITSVCVFQVINSLKKPQYVNK